MSLFHEIAILKIVKSKVIISLFQTVKLSVSISPRNLYNSLKSTKEDLKFHGQSTAEIMSSLVVNQMYLKVQSKGCTWHSLVL